MQYLQPAGQPRLVTMKVNGPLIIGMRCLSSGSRSCSGIGRSSRLGMNGRSGLMTISPRSRQARPRIRGWAEVEGQSGVRLSLPLADDPDGP